MEARSWAVPARAERAEQTVHDFTRGNIRSVACRCARRRGLLQQVTAGLSGKPLKHVNNAIAQINVALTIK